MAPAPRSSDAAIFGVPLRRVRLKAFGGGGLVGLAAGLVEAELDDRDIGVRGVEEVVELGLRKIELDLIQRFERVAEVDQDQVALVAQLREESGVDWAHRRRSRSRLCSAATASAAMRSRSPSAQARQAFQSKRKN